MKTACLFGFFRGVFARGGGYIGSTMRPCRTLHNHENSSKILRLVKFIANAHRVRHCERLKTAKQSTKIHKFKKANSQ